MEPKPPGSANDSEKKRTGWSFFTKRNRGNATPVEDTNSLSPSQRSQDRDSITSHQTPGFLARAGHRFNKRLHGIPHTEKDIAPMADSALNRTDTVSIEQQVRTQDAPNSKLAPKSTSSSASLSDLSVSTCSSDAEDNAAAKSSDTVLPPSLMPRIQGPAESAPSFKPISSVSNDLSFKLTPTSSTPLFQQNNVALTPAPTGSSLRNLREAPTPPPPREASLKNPSILSRSPAGPVKLELGADNSNDVSDDDGDETRSSSLTREQHFSNISRLLIERTRQDPAPTVSTWRIFFITIGRWCTRAYHACWNWLCNILLRHPTASESSSPTGSITEMQPPSSLLRIPSDSPSVFSPPSLELDNPGVLHQHRGPQRHAREHALSTSSVRTDDTDTYERIVSRRQCILS